MMGQVYISLAEVAFYEGDNNYAIECTVQANKYCKGSKNWEQLVLISSKVLLGMKKT